MSAFPTSGWRRKNPSGWSTKGWAPRAGSPHSRSNNLTLWDTSPPGHNAARLLQWFAHSKLATNPIHSFHDQAYVYANVNSSVVEARTQLSFRRKRVCDIDTLLYGVVGILLEVDTVWEDGEENPTERLGGQSWLEVTLAWAASKTDA